MADFKLYEVLQRASLFLEKNGLEPRVAELLLQHHLKMSRNQFFMKMRESIDESMLEHFEKDIQKHVETGVPVQHLIGTEEFYGRTFKVNETVLIPRPETEEVVQEAIRLARNAGRTLHIADIGTGSGIIAITLALELTNAQVTAIDLSEHALEIAKENAKQHETNIEFIHGSFLEPIINADENLDMIVSNPPYIPYVEREHLSQTVTNFDPEMALFAENNGLAAYEAIIEQAKEILNPDGMLVFEIGHDQGETVPAIIRTVFPNAEVHTHRDINGKDRIVTAIL